MIGRCRGDDLAGLLDIDCHLGFEFFKAVKIEFIAEAVMEIEGDDMSVE